MAYPYTRHQNDWQNGAAGGTPITEAAMDNIEAGILSLSDVVIPDTLLDAKGDLIVASAADTPSRLAVGAANKFLQAQAASAVGWEYPPGYEIGYAEFTSAVTVSATAESAPTDVVSAGSLSFDGTPVIVEFFAIALTPASAGGATVIVSLWEDSTDRGRLAFRQTGAAAAQYDPVLVRRKLTPSAGSHTLKITATAGGGDGSILAGAGGVGTNLPGYIRITKA